MIQEMLSRNKCVIKIDISLFLAVQTLSGSVNSIVCDRNEFNTKKMTLQGLWFHVPSLNRTNGISIYLINKVAPKQKYQRRKRNKSESKTFMFHGGKTARTRTQSWRAAVHCRVRLKRRERPKAQWQPVGPWVPCSPQPQLGPFHSRLGDHAGPESSWATKTRGLPHRADPRVRPLGPTPMGRILYEHFPKRAGTRTDRPTASKIVTPCASGPPARHLIAAARRPDSSIWLLPGRKMARGV